MQSHDHGNGSSRTAARKTRLPWLTVALAALLAIVAWVFWTGLEWDRRSASERLAEIEAGRAIPDAENAAMIYNELLHDPNATSIMDDFPESPAGDILDRVRHEPWLSADFPGVAAWVTEHGFIIDRLLEASCHKECRFPISIDIVTPANEMNRAAATRQWGFLLTITANNDLAEGRCENAMEKWRCLLRMGNHWVQHPAIVDCLLGQAVTRMALESMASFVVAEAATESHLQEIEMLLRLIADNLAEQLAAVRVVEALRAERQKEAFGLGGRLAYDVGAFLGNRTLDSTLDDIVDEGRCALRGIHILIALQRYRIVAGRWPQNLDDVKSLLPQETLTDPLSKAPFVYRPAGATFVLYSKGKNSIDEDGKRDHDTGVDDWPIWSPRGRSLDREQER